jgi:hypothetical protein
MFSAATVPAGDGRPAARRLAGLTALPVSGRERPVFERFSILPQTAPKVAAPSGQPRPDDGECPATAVNLAPESAAGAGAAVGRRAA